MYLSSAFLVLLSLVFTEAKETICIPKPSNATAPISGDDVPAIIAALEECGNGGTIFLPSTNVYQIATPVDLSLCHNCTIQIDATLNISSFKDNSWDNYPAVFLLSGTSNNILINGTGIINNNIPIREPEWRRYSPYIMFDLSSASYAHVSGLTIRSPSTDFFNIADAHDVTFSSLSLSRNLYPSAPVVNSQVVVGFNIARSSHIDISQISMAGMSGCVVMTSSTNFTSVSDVSCVSGRHGFMIDITGIYDKINFSDISFKNLTVNTAFNPAGFLANGGNLTAENVSWEDVRVHGTNAAVYIENCQGSGCGFAQKGAQFHFRNVSFNNFEGLSHYIKIVDCPLIEGGNCDVQLNDIKVEKCKLGPHDSCVD